MGENLPPLEKAREIYYQMHYKVTIVFEYNTYKNHEIAKECSLMLVNELIKQWCFIYNETENDCDYWNEVKFHIKEQN